MTNELMHYGVLGMKWGVRKDRSSGKSKKKKKTKYKLVVRSPIQRQSTPKPQPKSKPSEKTFSRPKTVSELSDEELARFIRRAQLEKQYKEITATQKSKGRKFVEDVLMNSAKVVATQYTTQAMKTAVDKFMKQQAKNQNGSKKESGK